MTIDSKNRLIVITGPTAVGKTSFSIELAKHFKTSIISADSRQFYREMKIGTASPTPEEMQGIPHYFIGHISVTDNYNVSKYEEDVLTLLEKLFAANDTVIMTGGSGLYINAVCNGIDELPDPDKELRSELQQLLKEQGLTALRNKLKILDPDYYNVVDLANPGRLMRALEVCLTTGVPYSSLRKNKRKERHFRVIKTALFRNREELNHRINERVDMMIGSGLTEEVRSLMPYRDLNALKTVGYRELFAFLDGRISFEQAVTDIKTNSRRYAKRQMTWFRKDPQIFWTDAGTENGYGKLLSHVDTAL